MTTSCATIDDHSINRTFSFHCTVSLRNPQRAKFGLEPEPVQCLPASDGVVLVQFWFIVHCGKIISVKCDIYSLISIWLFTGSAQKSARDRVREMYKSVLQWLKMPVASAVLANGHPVICNCDGSSASGQVFYVLGNKEICSCIFYHFSILKWCKRLNFFHWKHMIVNLTTLSSLLALSIVIKTTYGANNDDKVVKLTSSCFKCSWWKTRL